MFNILSWYLQGPRPPLMKLLLWKCWEHVSVYWAHPKIATDIWILLDSLILSLSYCDVLFSFFVLFCFSTSCVEHLALFFWFFFAFFFCSPFHFLVTSHRFGHIWVSRCRDGVRFSCEIFIAFSLVSPLTQRLFNRMIFSF